MKWLLAMMSKGRDASEFFSDVVKNVVAKSVEVKKMSGGWTGRWIGGCVDGWVG